ncbi:hypothetical protein Cgig2_007728 [Carnegiea gigantea]|uniref:C3H1-type domain-containing protein n=1 Tax=Carnegiea gigantea TaxID=171969 RepID=A0A9Q1QE20_9CARY|nr:hypothetical protein Cgig2_007728 [Carnegiea gigantea]
MSRVDFDRTNLRGNYFSPLLNPTCDPNSFVCGGGFEQHDFESDQFRMYSFKIKKCPLNRAHDWLICPYSHQGERARRRDPLAIPYVAVPCPNYKGRSGTCPRGDLCGYTHGVFEYWLHPAKYRTRYCNARGFCTRPVCFFAHSPQELRVPSVPRHVRKWIQDTLLAELQARANRMTRIHVGGGGVGVGLCPNLMVPDHAGRTTTRRSDIVPNANNNTGLNF